MGEERRQSTSNEAAGKEAEGALRILIIKRISETLLIVALYRPLVTGLSNFFVIYLLAHYENIYFRETSSKLILANASR